MIKTLPSYSPEHILRSLAPKGLFPLEYLLRIYMLYRVHLCVCMLAKSLQSCMTLCNPMDCSPPVSLVHRVLQARILEWLPFLLMGVFLTQRSNLHLLHWQTDSSPLSHLGSPYYIVIYMSMENPMDRGAWQAIVHGIIKS